MNEFKKKETANKVMMEQFSQQQENFQKELDKLNELEESNFNLKKRVNQLSE